MYPAHHNLEASRVLLNLFVTVIIDATLSGAWLQSWQDPPQLCLHQRSFGDHCVEEALMQSVELLQQCFVNLATANVT